MAIQRALNKLDRDWDERVALIDEFARLDRLLPDGWGFVLERFKGGGWRASAFADENFVSSTYAQPTRLEALRRLNDALTARQEVSNSESDES